MEVTLSDIEEYIERVLTHSHKWIVTKGVQLTLNEINEADQIIRINDEFVRSLFFRLGKSLEPHTDMAKQHAASMREAANTWQQNAIKLISNAVMSVQSDNQNNVKEIKSEAQRSATDLRRQLEVLNKKYNELQTEHNFAQAALTLKEQANAGQGDAANSAKITELTLELRKQRMDNETLRFKMNELLSKFNEYCAGQVKSDIEHDIEKKKEDVKSMPPPSNRRQSPNWGKTRNNTTPFSSEWDSKGDSSASYSDVDNSWGNASPRFRDRKRVTPPREDRRDHRHRSPNGSRHFGRSHGSGKRPGSPPRNPQPSKRVTQRDAWMTGGKMELAKWTGVPSLKLKIMSLRLSDTQNLITRVKEADGDLKEIFYKSTTPYDQRATEELSKYLLLYKELGIPAYESRKRSGSLNFIMPRS